jgi:hypothetical protein
MESLLRTSLRSSVENPFTFRPVDLNMPVDDSLTGGVLLGANLISDYGVRSTQSELLPCGVEYIVLPTCRWGGTEYGVISRDMLSVDVHSTIPPARTVHKGTAPE